MFTRSDGLGGSTPTAKNGDDAAAFRQHDRLETRRLGQRQGQPLSQPLDGDSERMLRFFDCFFLRASRRHAMWESPETTSQTSPWRPFRAPLDNSAWPYWTPRVCFDTLTNGVSFHTSVTRIQGEEKDMTEAELAVVRRAYAMQVLAAVGVADPRIADAFASVPREAYLGPGTLADLPLGHGLSRHALRRSRLSLYG